MLHRARLIAFGLGLAGSMLAPGAIAGADDGRTGACTRREDKPSCTILRPPAPPARMAPADAPECIVAVGGLGSNNDDFIPDPKTGQARDTFEQLLAPFRNDPRYVILRFGSKLEDQERFHYDTYGSIDASGRALRDFVRSISGGCQAIHIVAHSMGGNVADRAFSLGLSGADGVVTYQPISTPHNGALIAGILTQADDIGPAGNAILQAISRDLTAATGVQAHDITKEAVRDLASIPPPHPPRGVVELRQRLASDEIVLLPDHEDRRFDILDRFPALHVPDALAAVGAAAGVGFDLATLNLGGVLQKLLGPLAEFEGHGGSLLNRAIRDTTAFVIRHVALPVDDRSDAEKLLIFALSVGMLALMTILVRGFTNGLIALLGSNVVVAHVRAHIPDAVGWWTTSWKSLVEDATTIRDKETAFVKGIVTRVSKALDRLGLTEDADDEAGRARIVDPRLAFVRTILGRAAQLLAGR